MPGVTPSVHVVSTDRGGAVAERIRAVRDLRHAGTEVQITGDLCLSTCTMLLGLAEACVSPHTTFGFHGPSRRGRPLDADTFEKVSRLIAAHYPRQIRQWYMSVARYRLDGVYEIGGDQLIAAGLKAC